MVHRPPPRSDLEVSRIAVTCGVLTVVLAVGVVGLTTRRESIDPPTIPIPITLPYPGTPSPTQSATTIVDDVSRVLADGRRNRADDLPVVGVVRGLPRAPQVTTSGAWRPVRPDPVPPAAGPTQTPVPELASSTSVPAPALTLPRIVTRTPSRVPAPTPVIPTPAPSPQSPSQSPPQPSVVPPSPSCTPTPTPTPTPRPEHVKKKPKPPKPTPPRGRRP